MEAIDAAAIQLDKIIAEIELYDNAIFTEQDNRVKIIDRILVEVLGYDYSQFIAEPHSGEGYIDYKVSISEIGKLIIEAKRDGQEFVIDNSYSGRAFNLNGPVFANNNLQKGISQTIYYAAQESVELGCLTNGRTWIVFRANRLGDGKRVIEGKGILFGSLEGVKKDFKLFYDLLSPRGIEELRYKAIFQEVEGSEIRTKEFAKSLVTEDTISVYKGNTHSGDFDRVMTAFFSRLSGDNDPDMIVDCFVETKQSQAAEYQLTRISEDLISRIKTVETIEGEAIQELIERIKLTQVHEFVLLIGSKGAGKSTFIERFFSYILSSDLKEDCVVVRINVGEYKGSEEEITNWLDIHLLEESEKTLYNGAPTAEEIQGIFYHEYSRLRKGNWSKLYEQDKNQFKIDFGKHIESRRENRPTEYIKALIGNIVRSRKKIPCVVFDNADHFSIEVQQKVYQYARSIYENNICLIIVPITDTTSWQLSKHGAMQSFESEALYLPTPSPKRIIEKRIEYISKKIEIEKSTTGHYFLSKGIKITLENLEGFVHYLQLVLLKDESVSKWIGTFANYDTRRCLDLTKDIITSPHLLSIDEFFKAYVVNEAILNGPKSPIKLYKIRNALIKKNYTSYPINHHSFVQNVFYSTNNVDTTPILSLRILQVLVDRKNDRGAEDKFLLVSQILDYFSAMSVDRSTINRHLQFLLLKGLIISYDPTIDDISYAKKVQISPSGMTHYLWGIGEVDYIYMMMEVTPITDKVIFSQLEEKYKRYEFKFELILKFIGYLENEDEKYCKIPKHISYTGQLVLAQRYNWLKKVAQKQLIQNSK